MPPQKANSNIESTPIHLRPVSPMENFNDRGYSAEKSNLFAGGEKAGGNHKINQKKRFLTRGSGTAGGKQGHQNPVVQQKQKL